jgi:hypothetical protein
VVLTHITFVERHSTSQTLCRETFAKTVGTASNECSTSRQQGVQSNSTCIVSKNNVLSSHHTGAFKPFRVLCGLGTRPVSNRIFSFCYVFWNSKLILLQNTYLHFGTPSRDFVLRQSLDWLFLDFFWFFLIHIIRRRGNDSNTSSRFLIIVDHSSPSFVAQLPN